MDCPPEVRHVEVQVNDAWKHRSLSMRCKTCMFWVEKRCDDDRPDPSKSAVGALGRCRRHAPTMAGWPAVFQMDWCGDHKLDENRI